MPKSEIELQRERLDHILRSTGFNHRTKALWAYYRGNESARNCGSARDLYRLNLELNGALQERLGSRCNGCYANCRECDQNQARLDSEAAFQASIKPTTIALWAFAKALIDIELGVWIENHEPPAEIVQADPLMARIRQQLSRLVPSWLKS